MKYWMLLIALLSLPASAQEIPLYSGNGFLARCDRPDNFNATLCMGYVIGMTDYALRARHLGFQVGPCFQTPAHGTSYQQWYDIFLDYLRKNPASRHGHSAELFILAASAAFPCRG